MADSTARNSDDDRTDTKELAREIHWVEKVTMWSQIGLGLIGIAALIIYGRQLSTMNGQLDIMQRQLAATDRPWIEIVKAIPTDLHFIQVDDPFEKRPQATVGIKLVVKNVGRTVTQNVRMKTMIIHQPINCPEGFFLSEERRTCQSASRLHATNAITLFPDRENLPDDMSDFFWSVVEEKDLYLTDSGAKYVHLVFAGCVAYDIPGAADNPHHTGFVYTLNPFFKNGHVPDYQNTPIRYAIGTGFASSEITLNPISGFSDVN